MSKRANRQKRKAEAPNGTLRDESAKVTAGLTIFELGGCDKIIIDVLGEPGEGYQALIQAVPAESHILYALSLSHGLRRNEATLQAFAQSQTIVLQLVHNAYALGIKHALLSKERENG